MKRSEPQQAALAQWFVKSEDLACVVIGPFPSKAKAAAHAAWLDQLPIMAINTVVSAAAARRLLATGRAWKQVSARRDRATVGGLYDVRLWGC